MPATTADTKKPYPPRRAASGFSQIQEGHLANFHSLEGRLFIDPALFSRLRRILNDEQWAIFLTEAKRLARKNPTVIASDEYLLKSSHAIRDQGTDQKRLRGLFGFLDTQTDPQGRCHARVFFQEGIDDFLRSETANGLSLFHAQAKVGLIFMGTTDLHKKSYYQETMRALYGDRFQENEDEKIVYTLLHEMGHGLEEENIRRHETGISTTEDNSTALSEQFATLYATHVAKKLGFQKTIDYEALNSWQSVGCGILLNAGSPDALFEDKLPPETIKAVGDNQAVAIQSYAAFLTHANGKDPLSLESRVADLGEVDQVWDDLQQLAPKIQQEFAQNKRLSIFLDQRPRQRKKRIGWANDYALITAYIAIRDHWDALAPISQDMLTRFIYAHYLASGGKERKEENIPLNFDLGRKKGNIRLAYGLLHKRLCTVKEYAAANPQPDILRQREWYPGKKNPLGLLPRAAEPLL